MFNILTSNTLPRILLTLVKVVIANTPRLENEFRPGNQY
jgi:hypothetical protein